MREPLPLGTLLERLLARMGVADLTTWQRIRDGWGELAGPPWDTHARPVALREGVLVVEAVSPSAISLLRYGVAGLRTRLDERVGGGVVREVSIRPPQR